MSNQCQVIRQMAALLVACGLIASLLPGFATADDLSNQAAHRARAGAIVPLDGPVLAGKPVTFKLSGNPSNPHWDFGDGATADGSSVTHTYQKPGIYHVVMGSKVGGTFNELSSAIVRVHTPETLHLPQVLLDTDASNEVDDQHYIAYGLFSELDVLGINSVHHARWDDNETRLTRGLRSEENNYDEILKILDLSKKSGLPDARVPMVFRGAAEPLKRGSLASDRWFDTKPIVTEASEAILAVARGASPDNPVWVLPVGPCTNVASAILLAREKGLDLKSRIRIVWLGGIQERVTGNFNGDNDPWSVYVTGQSDVEFWIIPARPTGVSLLIDKRFESDLYPDSPLGEYLKKITPAMVKALLDVKTISVVISNHVAEIDEIETIHATTAPIPWHGRHWLKYVTNSEIHGPDQEYRFRDLVTPRFRGRVQGEWQVLDSPTNVRIIHDVDEEAMKVDFFDTLNGRPTSLPPKQQNR